MMPTIDEFSGGCWELKLEEVWQELDQILTTFKDIFEEPKGLPPVREQDHRITLKEGF